MDEERQKLAREYARLRRRVFFAGLVLGAALLAALLLGASEVIKRLLVPAVSQQALLVALYFLVVFGCYKVLSLPLDLFGGLILPRRYELSVQTLGQWLADWGKSTLISLAFALALVEVVYYFLAFFPSIWWLLTGVVVIVFTVVLAQLSPVLLMPLFYKLEPLKDAAMTRRLVELADRAGARVQGVYTINFSSKTTTANAAVVGLGRTRRLILGDTLVDRYTPDEVATVFAHELGHHVHADLPKGVAIQSALTLVSLYLADRLLALGVPSFGFESISDVAAMPLLALAVAAVALVTMPVSNAYSRRVEVEADRYALRLTDDAAAFVSAMKRLTNQNLAEYNPARWVEILLYTHPPVSRRIAMGEASLEK